MRIRNLGVALVALTLAIGSCSDHGSLEPTLRPSPSGPTFDVAASAATLPPVRISEIHYDNAGIDAGEAIEVSAPAGTSLSGWTIVLYNGSGGAAYDTDALGTLVPTACGTRFVVVLTYPSNGIQNGSPDGIALVDPGNTVAEFLSYEGAFTAVGGPANGMTSTDIGVSETGGAAEPAGLSLKRNGAGAWSGPSSHSFGVCNDDDEPLPPPPPPPPPQLPEIRFAEIHYDNFDVDVDEAIEIEGPAGADLTGWQVVLYNGTGGAAYNTTTLTGAIPPTCGQRGVVVLTYPQNGIQNGSPDGMALVKPNGDVAEFLSYEGTFTAADGPAAGKTSVDIGISQTSTPVGQSLQRKPDGTWELAAATFGACYGSPRPTPTSTISFSGRLASDPALPVGFEDQLFATLLDPTGTVVQTTFTWTSETPAVITIDANGVMHAVAAGTGVVRATAADGTTRTFTQLTTVATASTTAQYGNNSEFGDPTDTDASDDFIIRRPQFTTSYNRNRNTPNWVSYNLEATHFGTEVDRCDCFTHDALLPSSFAHLTTADYTGAGAAAGFGIDRGHLARSFDRTSGTLDNATTYYLSNIIPQAADNNQGPWAAFENQLGAFARDQNKEVYIVAGVAGSRGTVKNEGKITIPAQVWKVAVIMPRNQGLIDVDSHDDIEVIAVIMPNESGIRNVNWESYKTTVDAVEALSGYDLLPLLPDQIEIAVESNTKAPIARTDGPYTSSEGSAITMSATSSTDPDGDPLTYEWDLGDGTTKHGGTISHTYMQDGIYDVRLTVTDSRQLTATTTTRATVANVAPVIGTFAGATLLPGERYTANGSFADPGADRWTATVNYGDGTGLQPLSLTGRSFSLSHTYTVAGSFLVTVSISDDDVTATRQQSVIVQTPAQGTENVIDAVGQLARSGALDAGNANALTSKLSEAVKQLEARKITPAVNQLESFLNQVSALERSDRLSSAQAAPLRVGVQRVIRSVSP